jgi:hypothetical protein
MKPLYIITNWDDLYENNRTRGMKVMQWVPVPNKHDGEGFVELLSQPNGTTLYGAWHLILQVASKCKKRGVLAKDNGVPHDAASIAAKTRGSLKAITEAFEVCTRIGWITATEWSDSTSNDPALCPQSSRSLPAVCPHPTDEEEKGREENGMEGRETACAEPPSAASTPEDSSEILFTFPVVGKGPKEWHFRDSLRMELAGLFPGVDVVGETRKALAWVLAKPQNRKTYSGMRAFLTNWLTRATNSGGRAQSVTNQQAPRFREVKDHKKNHPLAGMLGPNLDGKVPY